MSGGSLVHSMCLWSALDPAPDFVAGVVRGSLSSKMLRHSMHVARTHLAFWYVIFQYLTLTPLLLILLSCMGGGVASCICTS